MPQSTKAGEICSGVLLSSSSLERVVTQRDSGADQIVTALEQTTETRLKANVIRRRTAREVLKREEVPTSVPEPESSGGDIPPSLDFDAPELPPAISDIPPPAFEPEPEPERYSYESYAPAVAAESITEEPAEQPAADWAVEQQSPVETPQVEETASAPAASGRSHAPATSPRCCAASTGPRPLGLIRSRSTASSCAA